MELKLGKMTSQELAEWFGVTYGTFRNSSKKRLEELKNYCMYQKVRGGVIIEKVYILEFIKPTPGYFFVKEQLMNFWHPSGYDTAARVGSAIYYAFKDTTLKNYKESTIKAYAAKARLEKFGHVYLDDHGTDGSCHPEPVVDNHWDEAELLTPGQLALYRECLREAYYDEQEAMIEEAYALNLITDAEYNLIKKTKEINSKEIRAMQHQKMIELCIEKIGFYPNQITKIEQAIYFS